MLKETWERDHPCSNVGFGMTTSDVVVIHKFCRVLKETWERDHPCSNVDFGMTTYDVVVSLFMTLYFNTVVYHALHMLT